MCHAMRRFYHNPALFRIIAIWDEECQIQLRQDALPLLCCSYGWLKQSPRSCPSCDEAAREAKHIAEGGAAVVAYVVPPKRKRPAEPTPSGSRSRARPAQAEPAIAHSTRRI